VDDDSDRRYSRAPEVEDLAALCAALNREGARAGAALLLRMKETPRESDRSDQRFLRSLLESRREEP
jgi:hypothetical protein